MRAKVIYCLPRQASSTACLELDPIYSMKCKKAGSPFKLQKLDISISLYLYPSFIPSWKSSSTPG
jgi:hypothetical protein